MFTGWNLNWEWQIILRISKKSSIYKYGSDTECLTQEVLIFIYKVRKNHFQIINPGGFRHQHSVRKVHHQPSNKNSIPAYHKLTLLFITQLIILPPTPLFPTKHHHPTNILTFPLFTFSSSWSSKKPRKTEEYNDEKDNNKFIKIYNSQWFTFLRFGDEIERPKSYNLAFCSFRYYLFCFWGLAGVKWNFFNGDSPCSYL